jgi:hypothetical protein
LAGEKAGQVRLNYMPAVESGREAAGNGGRAWAARHGECLIASC